VRLNAFSKYDRKTFKHARKPQTSFSAQKNTQRFLFSEPKSKIRERVRFTAKKNLAKTAQLSFGERMDKAHRAEFMIDQFNKYVSWAHIYSLSVMFSMGALVISVFAIFVGFFSGVSEEIGGSFKRELLVLCIVLPAICIVAVLWYEGKITTDRKKLSILMGYWQICDSLPDDLTFHMIAEEFTKAEDLMKFLEDLQPDKNTLS